MKGRTISLRIPEPADIDLIYRWENDPVIWHISSTTAPYSRYDIEQYVLNTRHDLYAAGQLRLMIVPHVTPETPAGTIDLFDFDPVNRRAGVGILIEETERGNGYASEALRLLCDYCFSTLDLNQLYCHITPDNLASLNLFKKAGFSISGTCREWIWSDKKWNDAYFMQLISGKTPTP